jgi:hypothetical protein
MNFSPFKMYLLKVSVLSLFVILGGVLIYKLLFEDYFIWYFPFIPLFFMFFSIINHWILLRTQNKEITKFNTIFTLVTGIKLVIYLIIIALFAFYMKKDVLVFIVPFIITYIIYSVFNTRFLMKMLHFTKNN